MSAMVGQEISDKKYWHRGDVSPLIAILRLAIPPHHWSRAVHHSGKKMSGRKIKAKQQRDHTNLPLRPKRGTDKSAWGNAQELTHITSIAPSGAQQTRATSNLARSIFLPTSNLNFSVHQNIPPILPTISAVSIVAVP
ncbi:MAG: hypothetical protein JNM43_20555 [Planctomycetaceae bacterium]|nr:hypothetical protein [Planctomycetaceae bacterium]